MFVSLVGIPGSGDDFEALQESVLVPDIHGLEYLLVLWGELLWTGLDSLECVVEPGVHLWVIGIDSVAHVFLLLHESARFLQYWHSHMHHLFSWILPWVSD